MCLFLTLFIDKTESRCYNQKDGRRKNMIMLDKCGDELYRLRSIGKHDSRIHGDFRFFRSKNYWGLHYVSRGSGRLILRGVEYEVSAGMLFLTPPFEPINYYSDEEKLWEYYFIAGYPDSVLDIAKPLGMSAGNFTAAAKNPDEIRRLFEEFFENEREEVYFRALSVLNKILSLEYVAPKRTDSRSREEELARSVDEIIRFNYKNPEFSVSDIADMLHLHPSRLSRVYKSACGESPISRIIGMRLEYAAELARSKKLSVAELCRECGFGDERYFMRRFKEKFGKTVGEYRKEN